MIDTKNTGQEYSGGNDKAIDRFNPQAKLAAQENFVKFLKGEKVYPVNIEISPSHTCQCECSWCFYAGTHVKPNIGMMDKEILIKLLNDLAALKTKAVSWSVRGDENVLISDENGIKLFPISDISNGRTKVGKFSIGEKEGKIIDGKIVKWYRHKANTKLIKITTSGGYSLTMTPNHSAYIFDGSRMINIPVSELKVGDLVGTPTIIKTPDAETFYSKDFFRLLGYFVSEGNYNESSITFALGSNNFEKGIEKDISTIAKTMGYNTSTYLRRDKEDMLVHIFSKKFRDEVSRHVNSGAHNKNIPDIVFNTTKEKKLEFLYSLYAGDGCVRYEKKASRFCLGFKTVSKSLAEGLVLLWRTLGEFPSLVYGISPERYIEGRKLEASHYYSVEFNGQRILKYDFIKRLYKEKGINYELSDSIYSFKWERSKIISGVYNDLTLLKIKKIEILDNDPDELVYDIEVENTNNFFCGSGLLLTHNTGGGESGLYPHISEMVDLVHSLGMKQGMFTNAHYKIKFDPTKFEWIRVSNTDRKWPIENLKFLRDKVKVLGMAYNYAGNDDEVREALAIGKEVGVDYVQVRQALNLKGLVTDREPPKIDDPLLFITKYKFDTSAESHSYDKCYGYHFTPFVWENGDVSVCGYMKKEGEPYILGNLHKNSFKEIFDAAPLYVPVKSTCQTCCRNDQMNKLINNALHLKDSEFV